MRSSARSSACSKPKVSLARFHRAEICRRRCTARKRTAGKADVLPGSVHSGKAVALASIPRNMSDLYGRDEASGAGNQQRTPLCTEQILAEQRPPAETDGLCSITYRRLPRA